MSFLLFHSLLNSSSIPLSFLDQIQIPNPSFQGPKQKSYIYILITC